MEAFCIGDTKAETHNQPWFAENQQIAMRLLREPCNEPTHTWFKHAEDFHLYKVGDWDGDLAELRGHPKKHITCLDALRDQAPIIPQGGE